MSPWWSKSSSKEAKKKANGGGIFGLFKRKLKSPSESKQISSRRRIEIASEMASNSQTSSPSNKLSENLLDMGRVDLGKHASVNEGCSKGSSSLFFFPLPKSTHALNGHDQTDVDGDLARDSVFTESDGESGGPSDPRLLTTHALDHVIRSKTSINSPSSRVTITQKKMEKLKPVKEHVSNQTLTTSQMQHPHHMANLQNPQSGGFFRAPDSSNSSPYRSPMRVSGPGPNRTSGLWARRPYADTLGSGLCSSPEPGHNSSHNPVGFECSPIPTPRLTSPGPRSRIQSGPVTPLHPWARGSNMGSSANWAIDAVNETQQTHRLPLPPQAGLNSPSSYSTRSTPTVPRSPGRADLVANHSSRWKKGQLLGQGSFGHVYLGFNSESGKMCAMKEVTLFSDDARSKASVQQLTQEIRLLSCLRHPNIVQYYGSETVDKKLYIYLEYVAGGSVHKLLQDYGQFGEIAIRNYTRQILTGLAYLHSKNTVHRGIKGANILVDSNGCVKIADFGMAKHISGVSSSLSFKGSPYWMAPEIIGNSSNGFSLGVDIWSLGCTVIEMATTKPPCSQSEGIVNSKEVEDIPDHISDDGKDFILHCMQSTPSRRPTAAQLLDHPFVKNISSSERLIPNPGLITNVGIGHAYEGQNTNRRQSSSPIISPKNIMGSPTPLTQAAAGEASSSSTQVQKPYTSGSPTRSFGSPSHGPHLLDPKPDMFRTMPLGPPFFQEMVPPDEDFLGNKKKDKAGKSVLVDH
ncbi:hypothetical protein QVD17_04428 [Tagetes erecta]|uniref:mitogen-activated protein kinase kinase kinase n=1 Tax=Tagetes erecta TaxID=13708 RepID=A0AAD8PAE9_TARER|nr:hypothetical protein QVD17_04428 [Tagetes erecta]